MNDYRIGNPSYDADFDFVQSYVLYYNKQASESEIKSLHFGYVSLLYKYLDKVENYLDNTQKISDQHKLDENQYGEIIKYAFDYPSEVDREMITELLKDPKNKEIYEKYSVEGFIDLIVTIDSKEAQNILKNRAKYLAQVRNRIEIIEKNLNMLLIQQAFLFISNIFCFYDPPESYVLNPGMIDDQSTIGKIYHGDRFCYLPNDIGLFGLNTYLYAYFNDVYIVGVPSRYQNFDENINKCPSVFMKHDYGHADDIKYINSSDKIFAHSLYLTIINDGNLSPLQVQLHILVLWIIIHEIYGYIKNRYYQLKWMRILQIGIQSLAIDFFEEMNRFRELVIDEEIVSAYIRYSPSKKLMPDIDIEASEAQSISSSSSIGQSIITENSFDSPNEFALLDKSKSWAPVYNLKQLNPDYLQYLSAYYDNKSVAIGKRAMSLLNLVIFYHVYQVKSRYSA